MSETPVQDVPSPVNLQRMEDARQWESEAMLKRPWRIEFFERFVEQIRVSQAGVSRVLELGSGPGFLAQYVLNALPGLDYTLFDFSAAMHILAQQRLGQYAVNVKFVERSFRESNWVDGLGKFDFVITNQAVHELRHKRHAHSLHLKVRNLLSPNGTYLVCDHFAGDGGMTNDQLYMTVDEQRDALISAGFHVKEVLQKGGLVLHACTS